MELRPALGAALAAVLFTLAACEETSPCAGAVTDDCEAVAGLYRGTWSSSADGGDFAVSVDETTCGVRGDLVFGSERAPFEGAVCNDGEASVALLEGDVAAGTGSILLPEGSATVEGSFDLVIGEDVRASAGSVAPGDLQISVEGDRFDARGATAACSLACNDGNPCTDDRCDADGACVHIARGGSCDDGDPCTTSDTCGGGTCLPGVPVVCNDGNACTEDVCQPLSGLCTFEPWPAGRVCNDGNSCTTADECQGGACAGVPDDGRLCDDGDSCTTADTCAGGACEGTPVLCDCGDGVCAPGEDCDACPADCEGVSSGARVNRFCCGNGTREPAEGDGTICDGND